MTSLIPAAWFPGRVTGLPCVSSGELISGCDLLQMLTVQDPEDLVSNWKPARSLVGDAVSGAEFAPFQPWLPPTFGGRWADP